MGFGIRPDDLPAVVGFPQACRSMSCGVRCGLLLQHLLPLCLQVLCDKMQAWVQQAAADWLATPEQGDVQGISDGC